MHVILGESNETHIASTSNIATKHTKRSRDLIGNFKSRVTRTALMNGLTASELSYPNGQTTFMTLIGRWLSPVWRRLDLLLAHSQHHHQSLQPVTSHGIPPQSFASSSGHTHTSQSLNLNFLYF